MHLYNVIQLTKDQNNIYLAGMTYIISFNIHFPKDNLRLYDSQVPDSLRISPGTSHKQLGPSQECSG